LSSRINEFIKDKRFQDTIWFAGLFDIGKFDMSNFDESTGNIPDRIQDLR